ncbi:MAG: metal ABC transporter ATP-binding protein, partial [Rhizobiaceae bacterium]
WSRRGLLGRITGADRKIITDALEAVGLSGFETRPIDTLSGGQLQRALFARVLCQDADLILLDEPFNAVDTKTVGDLIALIQHWHHEKRTIMVVAHDVALVREHFPQTLLLARQEIAWGATGAALTPDNLARARRFTEAWNENAPWCDAPGDMGHKHHDHSGHDHHHGHDHKHGDGHTHDHHHHDHKAHH